MNEALDRIETRWREVARFKYEENSPHDEALAQAELELDMHTGRVKIQDIHWLARNFENVDLIDLTEAIAAYAMPGGMLETLEKGETAIVTDDKRSIVFDIKFGREVSAGVSLVWAGDRRYSPTSEDLMEFEAWVRKRTADLDRRIAKVRNDLKRFGKEGSVATLPVR